jgi:hypothetical protein
MYRIYAYYLLLVLSASPLSPLPSPPSHLLLALLPPVIFLFHYLFYIPATSPIHLLPLPPYPSSILSSLCNSFDRHAHIRAVLDPNDSPQTLQTWHDEMGPTYAFKGTWGINERIMTVDPQAVKAVLNDGEVWRKPPMLRSLLSRFLGDGEWLRPYWLSQRKVLMVTRCQD